MFLELFGTPEKSRILKLWRDKRIEPEGSHQRHGGIKFQVGKGERAVELALKPLELRIAPYGFALPLHKG